VEQLLGWGAGFFLWCFGVGRGVVVFVVFNIILEKVFFNGRHLCVDRSSLRGVALKERNMLVWWSGILGSSQGGGGGVLVGWGRY